MEFVTVARLRRPRGNRGELIADSLTSFPKRFDDLKQVWLRGPSTGAAADLVQANVQGVWLFRGDPVFKFEGVDSISAAEAFAGREVCVPMEQRVALGEGEYFFSDIVGCAVSDLAGTKIGVVTGWHEGPAQVLMEIEDVTGAELLVPFVRAIFREIDVDRKAVVVDLPDGLREMNR